MKPTVHAQNVKDKEPNLILAGLIGYDVDDYGGNFANYTPPTPTETDFDIRVVEDTNSTNPGKRLYIYAGGFWYYVDLTKFVETE